MNRVAIVGAGQMGVGIAHVCLVSGFKVTLVDQSDDQLFKANSRLKEKIPDYFNVLEVTKICDFNGVDMVIEAIAENLDVKKIFGVMLMWRLMRFLQAIQVVIPLPKWPLLQKAPSNLLGFTL